MFDGVKKYKEEDVDFADRKPEFEMLFDLAADPGELNNLIKDMEDTKLLESFRQKTAAYSISLNEKREKYKAVVTTQSR
jgi:hypothetical protein